jgi:hypothetical protein
MLHLFQQPNDPIIYYCSVSHDCEINQNNEYTIAGGNAKVICKSKNCGTGCKASKVGCVPPCTAVDPNQPTECQQETSSGGGTLGSDVIKVTVGAILAWLADHCC